MIFGPKNLNIWVLEQTGIKGEATKPVSQTQIPICQVIRALWAGWFSRVGPNPNPYNLKLAKYSGPWIVETLEKRNRDL